MLETVKERHLRKPEKDGSATAAVQASTQENAVACASRGVGGQAGGGDSGAGEAGAGLEGGHEVPEDGGASPGNAVSSTATATADDDGCRLLPKLVDVRSLSETRSKGVKGSLGVDVGAPRCVSEFLAWARKRETEVLPFGLRPMHILMTSDGSLGSDQQRFVLGVLEQGLRGVCVLCGGYEALRPFFVDVDGGGVGGGASAAALAGRKATQEAKELFSKGIGGLQNLWQKAPSRHQILEKVQERGSLAGKEVSAPSTFEGAPTFERAPAPPSLPLPAAGGSSPFPATSTSDKVLAATASALPASPASPAPTPVVFVPPPRGEAVGNDGDGL